MQRLEDEALYTAPMSGGQPVLETDPVIEAFKQDVDRTLLRENLRLSPQERLRRMHAALRGLLELRDAFQETRRGGD